MRLWHGERKRNPPRLSSPSKLIRTSPVNMTETVFFLVCLANEEKKKGVERSAFDLDPKYCHIYHYCIIGVHQVLQCQGNLWYSTAIDGCDWPEKSDCRYHFSLIWTLLSTFLSSMRIGKAGHLYTSSTAATNMIDGDGNLVTTPRHSRPTNIVQGHFPDPYDCSAFHYCNGQFCSRWSIETDHLCTN
jgi:hypothetical protein